MNFLKFFGRKAKIESISCFNRSGRFSTLAMHELGITQTIIEIVAENAHDSPVKKVILEIGQLSAIMPDAIRFCFDICSKNTVVEGAILEILEISGQGKCRHCGQQMTLEDPFGICDRCGSLELDIIQGKELKIKAMEIEKLCV